METNEALSLSYAAQNSRTYMFIYSFSVSNRHSCRSTLVSMPAHGMASQMILDVRSYMVADPTVAEELRYLLRTAVPVVPIKAASGLREGELTPKNECVWAAQCGTLLPRHPLFWSASQRYFLECSEWHDNLATYSEN